MMNYKVTEMDIKLFNRIDEMVCDYYGYIDENTYSDLLFIVKFGLGMVKNYKPDDYMYDIFDKLCIFEGYIKDEELVNRIKTAEEQIATYDEWQDYEVAMIVKGYLMNKEFATLNK